MDRTSNAKGSGTLALRTALLAACVLCGAALSGCGGNPPAPGNSNPFGDVTAGDPGGAARPPAVRVAPANNAANGSGRSEAAPVSDSGGGNTDERVAADHSDNSRPGEMTKSRDSSPFGTAANRAHDDGTSTAAAPGGVPDEIRRGFPHAFAGDHSVDMTEPAETASAASATDWAQFRGPGGSGISPYDNVPVSWSDDQNVAWKEFLPGRGSSSPIVVGDRVIVTYYAGYGIDDRGGNPSDLQRWIVCFDRYSGVKQWEYMVPPTPRVTPYRGDFIAQHGYASSTPVSNGNRVYAAFDTAGVVVISPDGRSPARINLGRNTHKWGAGSSPILYNGLLIANAAIESGALGAIRATTGQLVWQITGIEDTWATPTLVETPGGRPEIVLSTKGKIISVDAQTGARLWYCDGIDQYVVPSVVAADGVVYAIGGRSGKSMAVRTGGRGDVTRTHVLWRKDEGANVPSPVIYEGHLYWVSENGVAYCLDAETGEIVTRRRVDTGEVYASPIVAGGKIYVVSRRNGTFVFEANPQMEQVAHNTLSGDDSLFNASPAVADGQIFLRSDRYLYCVSQQ